MFKRQGEVADCTCRLLIDVFLYSVSDSGLRNIKTGINCVTQKSEFSEILSLHHPIDRV